MQARRLRYSPPRSAPQRHAPQHPAPQRGISLVELLISITLGLVLIAAIGHVFLGGRVGYRTMDAMSRLQENARFAFETLAYDLRMAGFAGCSHSTEANVLNNTTDWDKNLFGQPLIGYEQGVSTFPTDFSADVLRGDAVTVLRADNAREYLVSSHNPSAAQFQLSANHDLKQGEILVATDCSHAAIFQMTNVNNNNTIATVVHNTGGGVLPGNCTKGLGNPVVCTALGTAYTFGAGSRVLRLSAVTYYIRSNAAGEPALYRQKLGHSGGNAATAATAAEELAEGVEDMQILYGVDTSATADQAVDTYVTADQVTAVAPGASNAERWQRVLSARVSLLMATRQGESITTQPQTYTYNGTTATPNDRLLRKVFTTTVAIRNRL